MKRFLSGLLCVCILLSGCAGGPHQLTQTDPLETQTQPSAPAVPLLEQGVAVGESGKGTAAECFAFAEARCSNLRIDTHEKNIPMQRCLAKHGFTRCGIIYLEDGDPRIAYQKVINNG